MTPRVMTSLLILSTFCLVSTISACQSQRSTRVQCEEIFERLVSLELKEMGFDDAELSRRWISRLRRKYRAELEECVGKQIPNDAMRCMHEAKSAEQLSHDCLR